MNKNIKSAKGQVGIYFVLVVLVIFVVVLAGLIVPIGTRITSELFAAGENLMVESNASLSQIQNAEVKAQLEAGFDSAISAGTNNIEVLQDIFKYAGFLAIGLGALVAFLFTRQRIEFGGFV